MIRQSFLYSFVILSILLSTKLEAQQEAVIIQDNSVPIGMSRVIISGEAGKPNTIRINSRNPVGQQPYYDGTGNTRPVGTMSARLNGISVSISSSASSCGSSNGSIIALASGGTAPYSYSMDNGDILNTGNFPNMSAGNHVLSVKDANGATATVPITVLNNLTPPKLIFKGSTPLTRCGTSDATVTLEGTGGLLPYQYSLDLVNWQSSPVFTGLNEGVYDFYIRDANGCIGRFNGFNVTFNLGCNGALSITRSLRTCANDAGIQVVALEPTTGPFTYSLDGGPFVTIGEWTGLSAGMHVCTIRYGSGKIRVLNIAIELQCNINLDFITVAAACEGSDGSLTAIASNGVTPYTYSIDGINYQSSNIFTGLRPGNYYVTAKDANGITSSSVGTVYDKCPALSLSMLGSSCLANDGEIIATATKGTAPYQYSLDGVTFQPSNVFNMLAPGNYTVTLKDALGFSTSRPIEVKLHCLSVVTVITNATCGNNNGKIVATGSMGTAPYTFSIDAVNFQSSNIFTNLSPGDYIITVKDVAGSFGSVQVRVNAEPSPVVNSTVTPATCENNNGVLQLSATSGLTPYMFRIDGLNFQSGAIFNGLNSGTHTISVKDAAGCVDTKPVVIPMECPTVTADVVNETCGQHNGKITVQGAAGNPPYQYSLDGVNFQAVNTFTSLAAGQYTVTIKDIKGIINSTIVAVTNICPTVTLTVTDGVCGTANAVITANGSNGTAPYTYSIDGITFQSSNVFDHLSSGSYTVTIKDDNGLTSVKTTSVKNYPAPGISAIFSPANCLNNNGTITAELTGGTAPFLYSVDNTSFQSGGFFERLAADNYVVTVKDANGCTNFTQGTINTIDNLTLEIVDSLTLCEGKAISLPALSNGAMFSWQPANGLDQPTALRPAASPHNSINYFIQASLGICTKTDSVMVIVNIAPIANAGADTTLCFGQQTMLHGSGGVSYAWRPATYLDRASASTPIVMKPERSIEYFLRVVDEMGCSSLSEDAVKVTVTPPAIVFAGRDTAVIMGQLFTLHAVDVNNSGFVNYTWSSSTGMTNSLGASLPITPNENAIYRVTATTNASCEGSDDVSIKVYKGPEIYVPTAFTPDGDGRNDVLKVTAVGLRSFNQFSIFTRDGQRVFFTKDENAGWDGKIGGMLQGNGVFVWMAEGSDENGKILFRKGTVVLIR